MLQAVLKNGKTMIIRPAEPEEAQKILDYLKIVGGESDNLLFGAEGVPLTLEQEVEFISRTKNSLSSVLYSGFVDGEIVSMITLSSSVRERRMHIGSLGLSVLKRFWNQGIGVVMMQALIAFARHSGITKVLRLEVRTDNQYAIRLYRDCGFESVGIFKKDLFINGEFFDTLSMQMLL